MNPDLDSVESTNPPPARASGKATLSFVLGLMSLLPLVGCVTGIPAIVVGRLGLREVSRSGGRLGGRRLAVTGLALGTLGFLLSATALFFLLPRTAQWRESADRAHRLNNLRQIGSAVKYYQDTHGGQFPPAAIASPEGRPLLSWRVALLPSLGERELYGRFKLDEPWDGPTNRPLLDEMPKIFAPPGRATAPGSETPWRVFVGQGVGFGTDRPPTDPARTLTVVEATEAVPWTKPDELPYDPNGPLPPLGSPGQPVLLVLMADGSARAVPRTVGEDSLRAAIVGRGTLGPDG